MKNIAIYLPSFRGGGAERVAINLAIGIREQGHRATLVAVDAAGPLLETIPDDVPVIDLHCKRVITSLPALIKTLRKHRFTSVISIMTHSNVVANIAGKLTGTPVVSTIHNTISQKLGGGPKDRVIKLLAKATYRHSDKIICVSSGALDDFNSLFPSLTAKTTLIYNPVIPDTPEALSPPEHAWFAEPRDKPVIISVGRLARQKNYLLLLQAFRQVLRKRDANLIIFGEGEQRTLLEGYIADENLGDNVALPGFTNQVLNYVSHADVFALSSIYEGLPCVLIEAMSYNKPIVSTNCPSGPSELFNRDNPATVVPMNDADQLANGLLTALANPQTCVTYPIVESFTIKRATETYLSYLQ